MKQQWMLSVFELPKNDEPVLAISGEGFDPDIPTYFVARCMFKLDDNDKPTKERYWILDPCGCCYGHINIKVNRWVSIPHGSETKDESDE